MQVVLSSSSGVYEQSERCFPRLKRAAMSSLLLVELLRSSVKDIQYSRLRLVQQKGDEEAAVRWNE